MQSNRTTILRWAGAVTLLLLVLLLIIEGTWAVRLYHSWLFVSVAMLAAVLLLVAGIGDLRHRRWTGALSHIGLFVVLLGGMVGAVVETDVKIVVDSHATERVAYTVQGKPVVLPMAIRLQDFRIDYYTDGKSPKQYTSTLEIDGRDIVETSINHPARYHGWWIYQSDYDHAQGDFCILEVVRDPWLPVVYIGFVLMVLGALAQTCRAWHSWYVLPVSLVLAAVFCAASLARVELGTLMPALRSLWFFPHILVYMVAYSLLALGLIAAVWNIVRPLQGRWATLPQSLLTTASSLLLIGMLCGSVWAKDAWGDYWMWDAKECWAAVTWLLTIIGTHIPFPKKTTPNESTSTAEALSSPTSPTSDTLSSSTSPTPNKQQSKARSWYVLVVIFLTFASMQITWYGVNYLPSAAYSMHTYNK